MSTTRKLLAIAGSASLILGMAACSSERETPAATTPAAGSDAPKADGTLIGVAMPTRSLERWNNDGAHVESLLKEAGYEVSLQYADNKVEEQIKQLETMINQGAKVLVVASIDGTALSNVLETAAAAGIKVIAYDRLINGTDAVDYYATFDNYQVGQLQGKFIEKQLELATTTSTG